MYNVLAFPHSVTKDAIVRPFYLAKTYKRLSSAKKFMEGQKNHPMYYFEISTQNILGQIK